MTARIPHRFLVLFTGFVSIPIVIALALVIPGRAAIVTLDFNSLPAATGPAATNALNAAYAAQGVNFDFYINDAAYGSGYPATGGGAVAVATHPSGADAQINFAYAVDFVSVKILSSDNPYRVLTARDRTGNAAAIESQGAATLDTDNSTGTYPVTMLAAAPCIRSVQLETAGFAYVFDDLAFNAQAGPDSDGDGIIDACESTDDIVVTSLADDADANPGDGICATGLAECTLRAAIQEAILSYGPDDINFAVSGAINLTSALPVLSTDLHINGPGMDSLSVVNTAANNRVFTISGAGVDVGLSGLTISGGDITGDGGGIYMGGGTLALEQVSLSGNQSTGTGGGLYVASGAVVTVTDSEIDDNTAGGSGGGFLNLGTTSLIRTSVSNNIVPVTGWIGGGALNYGNLTVTDSTFSGNQNNANNGGAIFNWNPGTLTISGSTFDNNYSNFVGGAMISYSAGSVTLANTTLSGNTSVAGGHAIYMQNAPGGTLNLNNVTMANNSGPAGAGLAIEIGPVVNVRNSLFVNNSVQNCSIQVNDLGNNLQFPGSTCGATITVADPLLGAFGDNGGGTETIPLLAGSPAIDAGNNATCAAADQRGIPRPQGAACDIGAYEYAPITVNSTADAADANPGDGVCETAAPGECTLRAAIQEANAIAGPANIDFNIPGAGVQTIAPASALPAITDPVTIDGYSQPGASANTLATGGNATLLIQLSGSNIPGAVALNLGSGSDGSLVRGLVINNSFGIGVYVNTAADTTIQGNYIGTDAAGTAAVTMGNYSLFSSTGVYVNNAPDTQIGGTDPADRNVIAGINGDGIGLWNSSATGTTIQGNYIGVGADGVTPLPNGGTGGSFGVDGGGITLRNYTSSTLIGGAAPGAGNIIANNAPVGIFLYSGGGLTVQGNTIIDQSGIGVYLNAASNTVEDNIIASNGAEGVRVAFSNNDIRNNSMVENAGLGIDLGGDGVTFNHVGTIAGPNNYQNYPVLTLATSDGSSTRLAGSLVSDANQTYAIDIYASPVCDPTSFGEGQTYLGSFNVTTDSSGLASFDETLGAGVNEPYGISATATGSSGTSEFSYCRPVSTPNLNWVEAQAVATGSQTQQYITDRPQEKWFKFPVEPGSLVRIELTGLPGSAVSLHRDPFPIYNGLIVPTNAAVLAAEAANVAFLPSGSLPSGSLPSGSLPSGSLPSGSLPSGSLPTGYLPSGSLPSGSLPSGSLPSGSLPSGSLPSGSLPSGSLPSGSLPSGSLPSGSLPSGSLPSGSLPSGSLPSGSLPSGSLPSGSLDAYASAARRSLLGISMDPYATVQTIERNTYDLQEDLYIRVVGPYNLETPFSLDVTVEGGVCGNVQPVPVSLATIAGPAPASGAYKSLILTDSSRLTGSPGEISAALADLQTLAGRADVDGTVIDLADSKYERVAFANVQADQNLACASAKNTVAGEIKDVIDAYWTANPTLEYIVLAGGADVIPFFQVPDVSGLAFEKDYVAPVAPSTASEAGLKTNLVQGQDAYGSKVEITQAGHTLAYPGLAVGRLVNSASDISAVVNAYILTDGVIVPNSSLVTGYDFVGDAAWAIKAEMDAGTSSIADTLIQDPGLPPSDSSAWSADQMRTKLLGGNFDIAVLSGHFSAGNLLAADYASELSAAEVAQSSVDLTDVLVLTLGCHGGYTIPSGDLLEGVSPDPDWAKAFLRKGAAGYIAATGYAYGDTELTEYGERLFLRMAQQLRTGTGPVSIGKAVMEAKRQYLAETAQLTGIDQKTLVEMALYGLPMMKVDMPGARITPTVETSIVTSTDPVASGPGASFGLVSGEAQVSSSFTTHTLPLVNLSDNSTISTTYLSGPNGVIANPFEPILPKAIYDVSVGGKVLRGIALRGGVYADQTGVVPLTASPTTETSSTHLSYNTEVFYPTQTWMANYYDALGGGKTRLVAVPAQYQSSQPGAIDGTLRTFSQLDFEMYYLPDNWTDPGSSAAVKAAAVSAAPTILGASAAASGNSVTFSVNAAADGSAGVQAVWVLYTGKPGNAYYGAWLPLNLVNNADDASLWEGALTLQSGENADELLFMVQAVGGAGLTTQATNLGAYYSVTPEAATPPPPPAETVISLQSPPASGTYLKNSAFTLLLTSGGQPLAGKLVTLNIAGQQALATTDSSGQATITLKLVVQPGSYTAQASFRGDAEYLGSNDANPFTINKDSTTVTVTPSAASITHDPGQADQATPIVAVVRDSSGRALGGRSLFFVVHKSGTTFVRSVIADYLGNAPLGAVPLPPGVYTVDVYFNGVIPVGNGQTVTLDDDYYASSSKLGSSLTIIADSTPPTITVSATKADNTPYTAGDWTNQTVTVSYTCSDLSSGVASCPADQVFSSDGSFNASGTATDNAGNTATASFGPIKIDKTAPTLAPSVSPDPVYLNGSATASAGATDSGSGIASQSCGIVDTGSVDSKTVACTATDNAGNTTNMDVSYSVIYRFDGFLQPINDTTHSQTCGSQCETSIFKGGSTVPVKFQLKDANGNVVQSASLPVWLTPQQGGPTMSPVGEYYYSDPATSGSNFRWDDSGQQYIYNWKTKGFEDNYYYRIGVMFDDGQIYYVTIGLR